MSFCAGARELELEPGAPIQEKDIATRYEVSRSRTPVREALQRLAEEDLVHIYPAFRPPGSAASPSAWPRKASYFAARWKWKACARPPAISPKPDAAQSTRSSPACGSSCRRNRLADYLEEDDAFHACIARISGYPRIWKFITLAKVHLDRMRQLSAPVPGHLAEVTENSMPPSRRSTAARQCHAGRTRHAHPSRQFLCREAGMYDGKAAIFADDAEDPAQ